MTEALECLSTDEDTIQTLLRLVEPRKRKPPVYRRPYRLNFVSHVRRSETPKEEDTPENIGSGLRSNLRPTSICLSARPLKVIIIAPDEIPPHWANLLGLKRYSFVRVQYTELEFIEEAVAGYDKVLAVGWDTSRLLFRLRIPHFFLDETRIEACKAFLNG